MNFFVKENFMNFLFELYSTFTHTHTHTHTHTYTFFLSLFLPINFSKPDTVRVLRILK